MQLKIKEIETEKPSVELILVINEGAPHFSSEAIFIPVNISGEVKYERINDILFDITSKEELLDLFDRFITGSDIATYTANVTFLEKTIELESSVHEDCLIFRRDIFEMILSEFFLTYYQYLYSLSAKYQPDWFMEYRSKLIEHYKRRIEEIESELKLPLESFG